MPAIRPELCWQIANTSNVKFAPKLGSEDRRQRGEGKPETFAFLGFTHYCGKQRNNGAFIVWRETRVLHPYPMERFLANHPRWEPYA